MKNEQSIPGIAQLLGKLQHLPALSPVVQEVIASFNNPGLDGAALAAKISKDPALTSKLLRVANSSFYGFSRQISSLTDAIVVMGLGGVRALALSSGLAGTFDVAHGRVLDRSDYWKRSFTVAAYAKHLAKLFKQNPDTTFTAGVLHDIGLLVLETCQPEPLAVALDMSRQTGQSLIASDFETPAFHQEPVCSIGESKWPFLS